MHVLYNRETKETQIFKYLTPKLNEILGYSEQHLRRLAKSNDKIEKNNYVVHFNCYFDKGNKQYNSNPNF